ncbi:MAG: polysaccharide biosynthesis/export family protein [Verrucomicrobiota bacterium]
MAFPSSSVKIVCFAFTLFLALIAHSQESISLDVDKDSPSQMSLLDDDWELKIGDRLIYQVVEEREEPLLLSVNGNGDLLVPYIGNVSAQGKTGKQLAYEIKEKLEAEFFYRATVMITQREEDRNRGRVMVMGEVNRPGEQLIPADAPLTMSQAILQAGSFTLYADRAKVSIVSEGAKESRVEIDLGKMMESGDLSADPILRAGDVIIVARAEQSESQVYVLGSVQSPGLYRLNGDKVSLSQVIVMANGFTRFAKTNKVRLISLDNKGEKTERLVNVGRVFDSGDRSDDPIVKPGDMIIVDEKMISFGG